MTAPDVDPVNTVPRAHLVTWLMAAPALVGALGLAAIEGGGLMRPASPLTAPPPGRSFADTLRNGSVEEAYAHVKAGQDPNAPLPFRDPDLTAGREVMVTPLLVAVAAGQANTVMMLLSFGADLDAPGNARAACLADRLGHDDIAAGIRRNGRPLVDVPCDTRPPESGPRLLSFLD